MTSWDKISIAMCTYNGGNYLSEQLESIASQTFLPFELVICDDGSTDTTREIIATFAINVSFPIRLFINPVRLGSTKNFEKAITSCSGDIIVLADQDDVWHPEKLQRMRERFLLFPEIGMVFSDGDLINETSQALEYSLWATVGFQRMKQRQAVRGQFFEVLLHGNVVTGATMAFKSQYKESILPISPICVHDFWIALIIATLAKVEFISDPLIKYRLHANNQIGVAKIGYCQRIQGAIKADSDPFGLEIARYNAIFEHLLTLPGSSQNLRKIIALKGKIYHLKKRSELHNRLRRRFFPAVMELLTGRYQRYSKGVLSFARDIFC
jgi:glycosyltransferase involved in cell wall biosynthesis